MSGVLITPVLAVVIAVAKPRFVDALVNHRACKLEAAAAVTGHRQMVAFFFVGHVEAVVVAVAFPCRLDTATISTRELQIAVARNWSCTKKPDTTTLGK